MITIIENEDFSAVSASSYAVVDFSATWCGPCKMLAPIMEELAQELDGQVDFFNVDVDENPELAAQYGISSIPSLIIMKDGEAVDRTVGFMPKDAMRDFITSKM